MKRFFTFQFLTLLMLLMGVGNASAAQTPAGGGVYYIYNVQSGQFLSRGNDYGAHVCTAPAGILWQVVAQGSQFKLKCYDIVCEGFAAGAIGTNCYADNGTEAEHALFNFGAGTTDDAYTIGEINKGNLTAPATAGNCEFDNFTSFAPSEWQFLSKDEYAAKVAAATSAQETSVAAAAGITLAAGQTLAQVVTDESAWAASKTSDGTPNRTSWNAVKFSSSAEQQSASNEGEYGCEFFNCSGTYSKTITGLKEGIYKVTLKGMKQMTYRRACYPIGKTEGYTNSDSYFTANGNAAQIVDWASAATAEEAPNNTSDAKAIWEAGNGYTSDVFCYVGSDGKLDIKVSNAAFWWGCWFLFGGVDYTYYTDKVTQQQADELLNSIPTGDMLGTIRADLDAAAAAFKGNQTIANYNALSKAVEAAKVSVEKYAKAKKFLDELMGTNVYTADKQNELDGLMGEYYSYTLSHEKIDAIKIGGLNAWRAEDSHRDFLLSAWTIGGEQCKDFDKALYINTWSTEGETDGTGVKAPFYEYFASDHKNEQKVLAANTLAATMTGLTPGGAYEANVLVRVHVTNGQTAAENGITLQAGEGKAVDVCKGNAVANNYYYDTFRAYGKADASGNLVIKFVVAENSNITWLSFKNVICAPVTIHNMTITDAKWGTFVAPIPVDIPEGVTAYTVDGVGADSKLVLTEVTGTIPADCPVVVYSENEVNEDFYGMKGYAPSVTTGLLTGVYADTPVDQGTYVLQNQSGNVGFFKVIDTIPTLSANRAYMTVPVVSALAKAAYFMVKDEATSVNATIAADNEMTDGKYIVDGKFVIVNNGKRYSAAGVEIK